MKLKKVLAICLASAMTFSLAACGGGAATAPAPAAEENAAEETDAAETDDADAAEDAADAAEDGAAEATGDVPTYTQLNLDDYADVSATIKFLHHKTDRAEDGTMDKMVAAFNNEFPNIKVEMEAVTDYAEDSLLRLSTGDWGDIMFIPAVDKVDLETYFMPFDTLDNLSAQLNFVDNWEYDGN